MKKLQKYVITTSLLVCSFQALAEDHPQPDCGKTVAECQKVVDSVNAQLAAANKRISAYRELLIEANDRVTQQASK